MQADAKSRQFINALAWAVWKRFFSWRPKRGLVGRDMDLAINMLMVCAAAVFQRPLFTSQREHDVLFWRRTKAFNIQKLSDNR
jgi:hypothetical protein